MVMKASVFLTRPFLCSQNELGWDTSEVREHKRKKIVHRVNEFVKKRKLRKVSLFQYVKVELECTCIYKKKEEEGEYEKSVFVRID